MAVVFFPSFPFMGVMLFPSFMLGNIFGEGGAFHVSPSPFSVLVFLPLFLLLLLLLHLFFHISFSAFTFLPNKLFPSLFSSSPLFHLFPFLLPPFFLFSSRFPFFLLKFSLFFFEGTACTVCFQDVIDDITDCN